MIIIYDEVQTHGSNVLYGHAVEAAEPAAFFLALRPQTPQPTTGEAHNRPESAGSAALHEPSMRRATTASPTAIGTVDDRIKPFQIYIGTISHEQRDIRNRKAVNLAFAHMP
jgi:hypothetical protein